MKNVNDQTLGSTYNPSKGGTFFALFSTMASKVEVCIVDPHGVETRYELQERHGDTWQGFIPNISHGTHYGYRVYGSAIEMDGKHLLIDPYAKAIATQHSMLLSVVVYENYDWQGDVSPQIDWGNTIIYEAHVKGLTQLHPDIPADIRGSYAGLAHPIMTDYLSKLGITAIELLPVQYHINEPRLQQLGLNNYWGYNVLAPFAIDDKYWSKRPNTTPISEFKDMIKALHQIGIEVILDVVFNHTAELDEQGPTLSLKGIDKPNYYWLENNNSLANWTGCGNTLKFMQPHTIAWVMDCLRYYITEFHIDGFRFDLGSILGRTPSFSANSPLLCAILQDPLISKVKLISEPWDIGENGYQLGQFPYPFAEWNDCYRDVMRQFWLHGQVSLGTFAQQLAGSSQLFNKRGRKPNASINFITSHDGFTLNDLVSFNHKHNDDNGENNQDGHNQNWSNNWGHEGNDAPREIQLKRLNVQKNLLTTLLLSLGTPMLLAGDEWGNSQQGNNNSYCQDNPTSWLNWDTQNSELLNHVIAMIQLRKKIPALTHNQWWSENDVHWLNSRGEKLSQEEWQNEDNLVIQVKLSNICCLINATHQVQSIYNLKTDSKNGGDDSTKMREKCNEIDLDAISILLLTID